MIRAIVFSAFEDWIIAAGFLMKLNAPDGVIHAQAPPIGWLEAACQLATIDFAVDEVVDRKRDHTVWRRRAGFQEGRSRFERALPIINVVKCGQVQRHPVMRLNTITEFESDEFFRIHISAAELRDQRRRRSEYSGRINDTIDADIIFS